MSSLFCFVFSYFSFFFLLSVSLVNPLKMLSTGIVAMCEPKNKVKDLLSLLFCLIFSCFFFEFFSSCYFLLWLIPVKMLNICVTFLPWVWAKKVNYFFSLLACLTFYFFYFLFFIFVFSLILLMLLIYSSSRHLCELKRTTTNSSLFLVHILFLLIHKMLNILEFLRSVMTKRTVTSSKSIIFLFFYFYLSFNFLRHFY